MGNIVEPRRYKLAIVNWLSIYPLIAVVVWLTSPFTRAWPVFLTTLLLSAVLVVLMTFIVVPLMMRAFSPWLHSKKDRPGRAAPTGSSKQK